MSKIVQLVAGPRPFGGTELYALDADGAVYRREGDSWRPLDGLIPPTTTPPLDYEDLLARYMAHVQLLDGSTAAGYVDGAPHDVARRFSPAELRVLQAAAARAAAYIDDGRLT